MESKEYYDFADRFVTDLREYFDDLKVYFDNGYIYFPNNFRLSIKQLFYSFKQGFTEGDSCDSYENHYKNFVEDFVVNVGNEIEISGIDLKNWELIKDRLIVSAVPLAKVSGREIYKSFLDIAIVINVLTAYFNNVSYTFKPLIALLDDWGKTKDEVFNVAFDNTTKRFPVMVADSSDILSAMTIEEFKEKFKDCKEKKFDKAPIAITRKSFVNGATSIFVKGVLKEISDVLDDDLYICFTSRHEAMIHTVSSGVVAKDLKEVLIDTIKEATLPEDFLSYSIFKFSRNNELMPLVRVL